MKHSVRLAAVLVASVVGIAPASASAQMPLSVLDRARAAILADHLDEAERLLAATQEDLVDRNDLDFLRGTVALARGDYDSAIADFRAILARDPSLNRVRLDLARVLFETEDYTAADHHFRVAAAAGLPPEVQQKVNQFLEEIKRRKRWDIDLSLGIAPDSNVNAATNAQKVTLYGLAFDLDNQSRKTSGVGFASSLGGSYQAELNPDTRWVVGGRLNDVDYAGGRFDDRTVSAYTGPRFLLGRASEVTLKAVGTRRWYGGQDYSWGAGGLVEGETTLTPRLRLSGSLAVEQMRYDQNSGANGPVGALDVAVTYGLDATSLIRVDAALMREQARQSPYRDTQYFVGATYYRELPWGFGINLGANADLALYDSPMAAFGVTRRDLTVNFRAALSNRTIDLFGFTPVIAYVHTDRSSNINLFGFDRDRVEITMTRNF
jgi:tetratricopeptide (TPR) repeat protein